MAKALWQDKKYMQRVCPNKKKRKQYEEQLKRMDQEVAEVHRMQEEWYGKR